MNTDTYPATQAHDLTAELAKGLPAAIGALLAGLTLNQWLSLAVLVYTVLQVFYLMRKWYREEVTWLRKREADDE